MTVIEIKDYIEKYFDTDLSARNNHFDYVKYRFLFCYIAYYYATEHTSYQKIGDAINRNHATVINAVKELTNLLQSYPRFKKEVDDFKQTLPIERFDKDLKFQEVDKMKLLAKLAKKEKEIQNYRIKINKLQAIIKRTRESKKRYENKSARYKRKLKKFEAIYLY